MTAVQAKAFVTENDSKTHLELAKTGRALAEPVSKDELQEGGTTGHVHCRHGSNVEYKVKGKTTKVKEQKLRCVGKEVERNAKK